MLAPLQIDVSLVNVPNVTGLNFPINIGTSRYGKKKLSYKVDSSDFKADLSKWHALSKNHTIPK